MIHLAHKVTYCSSCHGQYLDRNYVDFDAYYDGPTIEQEENQDRVSIDDLIICDKCLKNAGELVGLYPAEDLKKENQELGRSVEMKQEEIDSKDELLKNLGETIKKLTGEDIKVPKSRAKIFS